MLKSFKFLVKGVFLLSLLLTTACNTAPEATTEQETESSTQDTSDTSEVVADADGSNDAIPVNEQEFDGQVSADTFDGEWPFTVTSGEVRCIRWNGQPAVTFYTEETGVAYGLNGTGSGMLEEIEGEPSDLNDIWAYDAETKKTLEAAGVTEDFPRISISDMIEAGLSLCGE